MQELIQQFVQGIQATTLIEYIAVFAGVASVVFSRIENSWVYPTGLINTIIYIYISLKASLLGEAAVNLYYTIMSVYGWWLWTRKDQQHRPLVKVTFSNRKEWLQEIFFFLGFYVVIFVALTYLKKNFVEGVIPWGDAFASATAFTGMWLMAKKKVESWWWWIATNIASIPLYFVKGFVFTSVYYVVLLLLAVAGLMEWSRRAVNGQRHSTFEPEK